MPPGPISPRPRYDLLITSNDLRATFTKERRMARPSQVQPEEEATTKGKGIEPLAAAVCSSVMNTLGRPANLFRVAAVRVWGNRFRVNVQTGADAVTVQIAHSFFVSTDEHGKVLESVPPITRCY